MSMTAWGCSACSDCVIPLSCSSFCHSNGRPVSSPVSVLKPTCVTCTGSYGVEISIRFGEFSIPPMLVTKVLKTPFTDLLPSSEPDSRVELRRLDLERTDGGDLPGKTPVCFSSGVTGLLVEL